MSYQPEAQFAAVIVVGANLYKLTFLTGKLANQKNQVMHKETYFLNLKTNQWTRGPDLNNAKIHLTCSLVTHGDGTKEIVAVGGSNQVGSVGCELLNEVEIINPATNTKRFGTISQLSISVGVIKSRPHLFLFRPTLPNLSVWSIRAQLRRQSYHNWRQ